MSKKEYSQSRRSFLAKPIQALPAVALASTGLGSVAAKAQMAGAAGSTAPTATMDNYKPTYFQTEEWAFLLAAVDHLIPQDEQGPGAIIAGAPEFIDRQMETPYAHGRLWYMQGPFHPEIMKDNPQMGYQINMNPREVYRSGIKAFNAWCKQTHGKTFAELDKATQLEAIKGLSDKKVEFAEADVPAGVFFSQLLSNTKEGFFADPMYGGNKNLVGWKMVGFPGARADFMDWIDRPNEPYPYGTISITGIKGEQTWQ